MQRDIILGLTGVRGSFAASLVVDGCVEFAVEEDKLRRSRGLEFSVREGDGSRAVDLALRHLPNGACSVGQVAYVPAVDASPAQVAHDIEILARFLELEYGISSPIDAVDHVDAHLAFERAVQGEASHVFMLGRTRAVYSANSGAVRELDTPMDIVQRVERLAAFIGFPRARVHHLENMARFGEPRFAGDVADLFDQEFGGEEFERRIREVTGLRRRRSGEPIDRIHYDFAASVHRTLQSRVIALLGTIPDVKRRGPVAVCGGVFQSWTLNDALATAFPESQILTSFAPGNASGAIGGPLVLAGSAPADRLGPFLGPEYSREQVKSVLDNSKVRYALHSAGETLSRVCDALAQGQMVGWFRGRCEFGYRALGSRSVFASPANPYACDNLSSYLKQRPSYFAYAVAIDVDDPAIEGVESPYLSRSAILADYFGDARVRIQSVSRAGAPALWNLLGEFRKETGVSALLNTSLNYFDEPIACTPRDALKTFYASGLDMLVMEDFLLTKD